MNLSESYESKREGGVIEAPISFLKETIEVRADATFMNSKVVP